MKKAAFLLVFCMVLITGCKKDNNTDTGTLKITFQINGYDFSNIAVKVFALENLEYPIIFSYPDNKGVFVQELLPGNYQVDVWYDSDRGGPTFQILKGEVSSFTMNLK